MFTIEQKIKNKLGRAGKIATVHGIIETPAFVTVGTKATVKALTPEMVKELGAQVVLANTYHLYLQPGEEIVKKAGGLGKFMNWSGPTMTDSGGFQVLSLGAAYGKGLSKVIRKSEELLLPNADEEDPSKPKLVAVDHDGVMFRSHLDGSAHYFTPEKSIEIQYAIGADIMFAFDECTSPLEPIHYQKEALERTHRWAKRSLERHRKFSRKQKNFSENFLLPQEFFPALFGIVQGGRHEDLRKESASVVGAMDFDGFGIGGSFIKEDMNEAVKWVNELLPEEKPRHVLGIGEPADIFGAIENGCDLFDCVAPTRTGRSGTLYTQYGKINIMNAKYVDDFSPIDEHCECYTCKNYTRSYIAHLFRAKEMLAGTLASYHNLYFIINLVKNIRASIFNSTFESFKNHFLTRYKQ